MGLLNTVQTMRDIALGLAPWLPNDRRYGLGSISRDELTVAIARGTPGAKINELQVEFDSRGTTDRARLHLEWNKAGTRAGLPETAFAKGTPSQASSRVIVSGFACHTCETRFYTEIYPDVADLTIKPFVCRYGMGGRYVIAMADLVPDGATFYDADDQAPESHVFAMIDLFAELHGRFWRSPRFKQDLSWVKSYATRPGGAMMKHAFRWSEKKFMSQERDIPEPVRRLTKTFVRNQDYFMGVWEAMPPTLCHGDCHLGNTYAMPDGSAGIYDWQGLHKMHGLRDFAYFMMHSVPTELRRKHEKELLRRYLAGLAEAGAGSDTPFFEEAWNMYRLLTIDGWLLIMLTMTVGGMQPDERMEVTANRAIATLIDLEVAKAIDNAL